MIKVFVNNNAYWVEKIVSLELLSSIFHKFLLSFLIFIGLIGCHFARCLIFFWSLFAGANILYFNHLRVYSYLGFFGNSLEFFKAIVNISPK